MDPRGLDRDAQRLSGALENVGGGAKVSHYQPFDDINRLLVADGWPPMIMNPQVYSRLVRALGWKEWIETKGKRGAQPPREFFAQ
jgi:hypothetical protein